MNLVNLSEIFTPHYKSERGLLATDHEILNHGQVTKIIPEMTPSFLPHHITGGHLNLDRFNVLHSSLHGGSSVVTSSNSCHASHKSVTLTTRLPRTSRNYEPQSNEMDNT
ncbi:hypothetical protein TNCV_2656791 [Trichonephila clavipes]|nr:hypothetical protein TNCV_2656791 [Trichonephila clavipes]